MVPPSLPSDEALRAFQADQRPVHARWQGLSGEEMSVYPRADEQKPALFKIALLSKVALYLNEISVLWQLAVSQRKGKEIGVSGCRDPEMCLFEGQEPPQP